MGGGLGVQSLLQKISRPFLVVVAPSTEQLEAIRQLDEIEESGGSKVCVILINARIRGLKEKDSLREQLAAGSNPIVYARFVGSDGFLFKTIGSPWVLSRMKSVGEGVDKNVDLEEVWRSENAASEEPSIETLQQAMGMARCPGLLRKPPTVVQA